jgi:acetylxylan esterase
MILSNLLKALAISTFAVVTNAAVNQLEEVVDFGINPTGVQMFVYKPTKIIHRPPLIVAIHYCTGTAQAYFDYTEYANFADKYGYYVVYPDAPDPGGCWDVNTNATLTHNGGGDSIAIASMIKYSIANYGVDPQRVYVTGTSSGAMMTNVLAGAYPDLFQAGAAFAGVPYACFAGPYAWNSDCSTGSISKTPQEWGDLVRGGDPGYKGPRPKMQIWQGTLDVGLDYKNFQQGINQWTNVFGYSTTPVQTIDNSPLTNWTRYIFGPKFQAISALGVDHNIPVQATDVLEWFGIIKPQPRWTQCGGRFWQGETICEEPYTCKVVNDYFSQCT